MKKFNITILSLIAALTLGACSEQAIEDQAKSVFEESSKLEKVQMNEFSKENTKLTDALIGSLGIEKSEFNLAELDEYKEFEKNINKAKDKTKLTVTEVVSHDNDKAEVLVDISFLNVGSTIAEKVGEELERNVVKIYSEQEVNEEDFYTNTLTVLNESVSEILDDTENNYLTVAKNVKIKLTKEKNKWIIKDFNENVMNALTLNFHKEQKELTSKKVKEVKDNRIFIEKEANLKSTFETVKEFIVSKEIPVSELTNHNEEIVKLVNSKIGIPSKVVSELGTEEGLYYIVSDADKLTVTVINGKKNFTFTDTVQ